MTFQWHGQAISDEIKRRANAGLKAATIQLSNRVKETLSVPAPRVILNNRKTGERYYAAGWIVPHKALSRGYSMGDRLKMPKGVPTWSRVLFLRSPATPGAPPRKLSGRLRTSITWEVDPVKMIGRVGTNVKYGRTHEAGTHQFLAVTLLKFNQEIAALLGSSFGSRTVFGSP